MQEVVWIQERGGRQLILEGFQVFGSEEKRSGGELIMLAS